MGGYSGVRGQLGRRFWGEMYFYVFSGRFGGVAGTGTMIIVIVMIIFIIKSTRTIIFIIFVTWILRGGYRNCFYHLNCEE